MKGIGDLVKIIFPKTISDEYKGSKTAYWVFALLSIVSFIRSCIHMLAPDGGAGSIAGLDLSQGAENIIFSFGLWGLSQLLYAVIQLMVAFRYKTLIPLMYVFLILETIGRMYVGMTKPPVLFHTPPGGAANYIILPLAVVMLVLSLISREKK
ncbi:MAG: hypothetical protein ACOZCL_17800 [Bacillota bacterium]